jgi:hypothetical protein
MPGWPDVLVLRSGDSVIRPPLPLVKDVSKSYLQGRDMQRFRIV